LKFTLGNESWNNIKIDAQNRAQISVLSNGDVEPRGSVICEYVIR